MSDLFYNNKKIGGGAIYTSPQVSVFPTPTESLEGTILQYIGETSGSYENGFFYKCELEDSTYKWKKIALDIPPVDSGNVYTDLELNSQDISITSSDYTFWVENETICHLILHLKSKRTILYANRWCGAVQFSIKNKSYNPPAYYLIAPATINTSIQGAVRVYGSSTSSSYGGIDLYSSQVMSSSWDLYSEITWRKMGS